MDAMVASGAAALIASRLELSKRATSESASACFPNVLDFCTRQFESAECITGGTPGGAGTHKGHTGHAVTHLPVAFDLETRKSLDLGQPCLLYVRSERSTFPMCGPYRIGQTINLKTTRRRGWGAWQWAWRMLHMCDCMCVRCGADMTCVPNPAHNGQFQFDKGQRAEHLRHPRPSRARARAAASRRSVRVAACRVRGACCSDPSATTYGIRPRTVFDHVRPRPGHVPGRLVDVRVRRNGRPRPVVRVLACLLFPLNHIQRRRVPRDAQ